MSKLGETLKKSRINFGLTLRQIEDASGISNAYLSQLENDKIKKPSANILYKLSDLYKIELNDLLIAAGIIENVAKHTSKKKSDLTQMISTSVGGLNSQQKKNVLEYIDFIKSKGINNK
jgi:HTH-type transcriptional regulator, competence development regulator